MIMDYRDKLRKQITEAGVNVVYTYSAHWIIVDDLKARYELLKNTQIFLMAISATGVMTSLIASIPWLGWGGGLSSALALGLNLYMLNFNISDEIKQHTDAANELWLVRELYKSLLVDFDILSDNEIREKRNQLIEKVNCVNKNYPGTDEESFAKAQKNIGKYIFGDDEAEKLMNVKRIE